MSCILLHFPLAMPMKNAPTVKRTLAPRMVGFLPSLSESLAPTKEKIKADPTVADTISSCQKLDRENSWSRSNIWHRVQLLFASPHLPDEDHGAGDDASVISEEEPPDGAEHSERVERLRGAAGGLAGTHDGAGKHKIVTTALFVVFVVFVVVVVTRQREESLC